MRTGWMAAAVRTAVLACVVLPVAGSGARITEAYAFIDFVHDLRELRGIGEERKGRWNAAVWGPGMTLTVAVPDNPRWLASSAFESMVEARGAVSEALRQWADVGTADIRWRVDATAEAGEGVLSIVLDDDLRPAGAAFLSSRAGESGGGEIYRCQITLNSRVVESSDYPSILDLLTHELGHCVGLDHPPTYPNDSFSPNPDADGPSMWGYDPVMAAGWASFDGRLWTSDRIGASLLRPAPGWLERTGTVYGTVLSADSAAGAAEEQRAVIVLITRIEPDGASREAIARYTNRWGQFVFEGLRPGNYVVMVSHLQPDPFQSWFRLIWEAVVLRTVAIQAGERTGPLVLTARSPEGE